MSQAFARNKSVLKRRSLFQMSKLTSVVKNVQNGVLATLGIDDREFKEPKELRLKGNKTHKEFASLNLPPKMRNDTSASSSWTDYSDTVEYLIEDTYEELPNDSVSKATAIYEDGAHRVVYEQAPLCKVNSNYSSRFS